MYRFEYKFEMDVVIIVKSKYYDVCVLLEV